MPPRSTVPLAEHFWAQVARTAPSACWMWQGPKLSAGYGICYHSTFRTASGGVLAHRVSAMLDGRDPGGLVVRHKCDTPGCVNPTHLELGTTADNSRDMIERGRGTTGPLTDEQVAYLRALPKGSRLPEWPGFTRDQIRNAAYWLRRGRTYANRGGG